MKRILIVISFITLSMIVNAQQTPPKPVLDAFGKMFPGIDKVEWQMEEEGEWEAGFTADKRESSVCYDNSGKWLMSEKALGKKELPAEIHKAIALQFSGFRIEEIDETESPDFKGYEIELEKSDTEVEIMVSGNGEITITSVSVGDDDEDEDGDKEE